MHGLYLSHGGGIIVGEFRQKTVMTDIIHILAQADASQSPIPTLVIFGLLFLGMWFLMIAPQRKRQKEHERLIASLKTGDEVMLTSGIFGVITNVKDDRVTVKIADNTKIDVSRHFVQVRLSDTKSGSDK